jgi:hypothetical protein
MALLDSPTYQLEKDWKGNIYFHKFCFFSLCVTMDNSFNKQVTKEFPYSLLWETLPQKCLFLVPYKEPFYDSSIQPNMSQYL